MIDQGSELSVSRQCEILELNRTGVYYAARPVSEGDMNLMRRIDELHLKHPFYGARRLHVATLMRRMGVEAIYRRPRTSISGARRAEKYCRFGSRTL